MLRSASRCPRRSRSPLSSVFCAVKTSRPDRRRSRSVSAPLRTKPRERWSLLVALGLPLDLLGELLQLPVGLVRTPTRLSAARRLVAPLRLDRDVLLRIALHLG